MTLTVENLSFAYKKNTPVLESLSFTVGSGESVAVIGANGAGKSTLFRCILGMLTPKSGRILIDGTDVKALPSAALSKKISYIPQLSAAVFDYTVLDTVLMGITGRLGVFGVPGEKDIRSAEEALDRVGIGDFRDRMFSALSGGERQLVLIARALAQHAELLLMDEPTSGLDYGNQIRVMRCVSDLTASGCSVLYSTHHPQHALSSDRVLVISGHRAAAFGPSKDVMTPELLSRLYGTKTILADTPAGPVFVACPPEEPHALD